MIKILEKRIADKIAAGEVIERPISIVKELVENSLDAGATSIVCEIKQGGKSYIRVTDNGAGISEEDVETAFLRHATSKISTAKDLDSIDTLGFRGEALASIAAVTRTEVITKPKEQNTGRKLILHGGEIIENSATGCPDGTTIVVRDLFFNTPARLKFMKSAGAESGMIIDFLSQIALAYKDVKFRLINNGTVIFSTLGDGNRLNTIIRVFKDIDEKNMVPVHFNRKEGHIEGYISTPAISKTTRGSQIFFVNGRVINSKVIEKGVTGGYKERLFEGRHPIAYLFLTLNPETLDVNIHPNKREVRFNNETEVIELVTDAIVEALSSKDAVVDAGNLFKEEKPMTGLKVYENIFDGMNSEYFRQESENPFRNRHFLEAEETRELNAEEQEKQVDIKTLLSNIKNPAPPIETQGDWKEEGEMEGEDEGVEKKIRIEPAKFQPFNISDLEVTGVIFHTYITAVSDDVFYMIDQHAAHERIFYEKLVGEYSSMEKDKQYIMLPIMLTVPYRLCETEDRWLKPLEEMGFTIEKFGQSDYRISEIPMFMELGEAENFLNEFIENIGNTTDLNNTVVIDKLIMMSCKAAIKANDILKEEELQGLIDTLAQCRNPFSCPHGRPTFIKLSRYEIEKMFKRV